MRVCWNYSTGPVYSVFGKSLEYSGNSVIVTGEIEIPDEQYEVLVAEITTIGEGAEAA